MVVNIRCWPTVPDAHDPAKRHAPSMLTSDLALRFDPIYEPIARRVLNNPEQLTTVPFTPRRMDA